MKRILTILLALLLLALCACAQTTEQPTAQGEETEKTSAAPSASSAGTPTGEQTATPESTHQPTETPTETPAPTETEPTPTEPEYVDPALVFTATKSGGVDGWSVKAAEDSVIVGELRVPAYYKGKPVLTLGAEAFAGQTSMTALYLPDTIVSAGSSPLSNCVNLETLVLSKNLKSFPQGFFHCGWNGNRALRELIFPEGVEEIDYYAFSGLVMLEYIRLPSTIRNCELNLQGSGTITHLTIDVTDLAAYCAAYDDGGSIRQFPRYGGNDNVSLMVNGEVTEDLVIPEGVTEIKLPSAFANMHLRSVTFPEGLKKISEGAFAGNPITKVSFPTSLRNVGPSAFENCEITEVVFSEGLNMICKNAFRDDPVKTLILPEVSVIQEYAFAGCQLMNVTIPDGCRKLGKGCFDSPTLLTITLPATVTEFWPWDIAPMLVKMTYQGTKEQLNNAYKYKLGEQGEQVLMTRLDPLPDYLEYTGEKTD